MLKDKNNTGNSRVRKKVQQKAATKWGRVGEVGGKEKMVKNVLFSVCNFELHRLSCHFYYQFRQSSGLYHAVGFQFLFSLEKL